MGLAEGAYHSSHVCGRPVLKNPVRMVVLRDKIQQSGTVCTIGELHLLWLLLFIFASSDSSSLIKCSILSIFVSCSGHEIGNIMCAVGK